MAAAMALRSDPVVQSTSLTRNAASRVMPWALPTWAARKDSSERARRVCAVCSAAGLMASTVTCGPRSAPKKGRLSTLINRPTASGCCWASTSPARAPIE